LLEREPALAAIERILDAAETGGGSALLIEAHAGMGKTRLHEAALDGARDRGMRVLRAAGAELEQSVAFGVARQLLTGQLGELTVAQREALLADAPAPVRALAGSGGGGGGEPEDAGDDLALAHGLFTLLSTADESRPALIAIDDLHWCDGPSLEFVLYILHRLDELPIAMLLTQRASLAADGPEALNGIAAHPRVDTIALSPLRQDTVAELVGAALGDRASDGVIEACHEATAGNPFYLHELLLALEEEQRLSSEQLAERARALAPEGVTRIVRVRVGRLGPAAGRLSRAVAILGDDAPLRHAAHLAGLPVAEAARAAHELANVEILLDREPLRFVHPLVRHAIVGDIPASERGSRHLDAARLLYAEGAESERVAAHLLLGRAEGDAWVVEQLGAAARDARASGAAQSAASYLRRALEEPPSPELRPELLAELGSAEAAAGLPSAAGHLTRALAGITEPRRRAELALERGRALEGQGRHREAAQAFEDGLSELGTGPEDEALQDQLEAELLGAATFVPALQARLVEHGARVLEREDVPPRTRAGRLLLAHAARRAAFAGRPSSIVLEFAERAWDDGCVLDPAIPQWIGWRLTVEAFLLGGDLERAIELAEAAIEDARRRSSPLAFATASLFRALPELGRGEVDAACADLESALATRRFGWHQFSRMAFSQYALCLLEKGQVERAAELMGEDPPSAEPRDLEEALCTYALGTVRQAQGRPGEALDLFLAAGGVVERTLNVFGFCPWRTAAAVAALGAGQPAQALELALEADAVTQRTEVLHQRIRALRVLGLCQPGAEGIATLTAAVELGRHSPPRLETVRALVDLGAAMRRANKRSAARQHLQLAADVALKGGATALHERARTELAATGARPRRVALLSGPASLTPSERRIAELAAAGSSNREIAQALFVTPKTVEYHLRNVYRKLEIEKRQALAAALGP
jgi:DNA-binding CsgD family transcriptional regulator